MTANPIAQYPVGGGGAIQLIQEVTLATTSLTATFSNIPQNFKNLLIVYSGVNAATSAAAIGLIFNGDSSNLYGWVLNSTTNGGVAAYNGYSTSNLGIGAVGGPTGGQVWVFNYAVVAAVKMAEGQSTSYLPAGITYQRFSGMYTPATAAAVTSIEIITSSLFAAGAVFSLYGLD